MIPTECWNALIAHLRLEADRLAELLRLLEEERAALRRLDGEQLTTLARQRIAVIESHQHLTLDRLVRLGDCAPEVAPQTLSGLAPFLDPQQATDMAAMRDELSTLVRRVQELQRMNEAYAETGRQTISHALSRLTRKRAGPEATYGANGRFAAHGQSLLRREG